MVSALGLRVSRVFRRYIPDPFVLALLLTLLTAALSLAFGDFPGRSAGTWGARATLLLDSWRSSESGLWRFLAFSMRMCFVLVTGHAIACSPPVRHLLDRMGMLARSARQGAALVAFGACVASLINWGLGLVAGAILALSVARSLHRRGITAHYPLLVGCGFAGFMMWHGGLSGSAPLTMASESAMRSAMPPYTIELLAGQGLGAGIPLDLTIFSPLNLGVTLGLLILIPLSAAFLCPTDPRDIVTIAKCAPGRLAENHDEPETSQEPWSLADWLEKSPLIAWLAALPLLAAVWRFGVTSELKRFGIDEVNVTMFGVGLILHGSVRSYLAAADEGAKACGGIILQFPLYGGILAMLVASGLDRQLASMFVAAGTERTLPLVVFLIAGVLNFFIPSGGGQWAVQGPVALAAGAHLGVDPGKLVLAVAYGDQITNMLQPFWALPLLAITGARARDIVGYSSLMMCAAGVWIALALLVS